LYEVPEIKLENYNFKLYIVVFCVKILCSLEGDITVVENIMPLSSGEK
jgi:hypothetical protein